VSDIWAVVALLGVGLLFGLSQWLQRGQAQATGAAIQAAQTTERVNADVAKAVAAERAVAVEPDGGLRAPDPDSRD